MTSARHPSVSVVVCTRDRAARLRVTLESLAGVRVPTDLEWEVVVVDNDSTDGTVEVVEAFRVLGRGVDDRGSVTTRTPHVPLPPPRECALTVIC